MFKINDGKNKEKWVTATIRLTANQKKQLLEHAKKKNVNVNQFIKQALNYYIEKEILK